MVVNAPAGMPPAPSSGRASAAPAVAGRRPAAARITSRNTARNDGCLMLLLPWAGPGNSPVGRSAELFQQTLGGKSPFSKNLEPAPFYCHQGRGGAARKRPTIHHDRVLPLQQAGDLP